eukprot:gene15820-18762_t
MTEGIMTAAFGIEAATETPPAMTTAMAEEDMAMPIGITAVAGSMTVEDGEVIAIHEYFDSGIGVVQ